jgi:hypothetical protein
MLSHRTAAKALTALFFTALLVLGCCIYRDYGLSWDEDTSRNGNGYLNYNYLRTGDPGVLLVGPERYHGPAFEVLLVVIEKLVNHGDIRKIHFLRHLVTFLLFYTAVFVFSRLLRQRFGRVLALGGTVLLVLSPRIFAESFYNSKDLAFLSCYVLALYTLLRFHRKMSYGSAVLHALACGFVIDIRILGIILPFLTFLTAALDWVVDRATGSRRVQPLCVLVYAVGLAAFTILFWPILWQDPVGQFLNAFAEMRQYPWLGEVLYCGRFTHTPDLPWHYLPVWIAITTPILCTVFFLVGLTRLLADAVRRPIHYYLSRKDDLLVLLALVLPLGAVIGLHAIVYDGWRHVYFIYPPLVYVATLGLGEVDRWVRWAGRWCVPARPVFITVVLLVVGQTALVMIREHPFQNVYFNCLAGRDLTEIGRRFDLDYWGLSYRRGLEYILEHDARPVIAVAVQEPPGLLNQQILEARQRTRLRYTDPAEADYFLTTFRHLKRDDYVPRQEYYAVRVDGEKILLVDKLR